MHHFILGPAGSWEASHEQLALYDGLSMMHAYAAPTLREIFVRHNNPVHEWKTYLLEGVTHQISNFAIPQLS